MIIYYVKASSNAPYGLCRPGAGLGNATGGGGVPGTHPDPQSNVSRTLIDMQIAVEYYLETDIKKAGYFQKKLNGLVVKSLNAPSIEKMEAPK